MPERLTKNPVLAVSCALTHGPAEEVFQRAEEMALDGLEWFDTDADGGQYTAPDVAAGIVARSREEGLLTTCHAPFHGRWNLAEPDEATAMALLREMRDRTLRLGARDATLHLGWVPKGADRAAPLERVVRLLRDFAPETKGVRLNIENQPLGPEKDYLGAEPDDLAAAFDVLPPEVAGWTFDTGHAAITGNLDELIERFGDRLANTHLHDNNGTQDEHLAPGRGVLDWDAVLPAIAELGYDGPLTLEFHMTREERDAFTRMLAST